MIAYDCASIERERAEVNGSGIRSLFLNELALRLTSGSVARVSQIADFNDLATKSKDTLALMFPPKPSSHALDTTLEASKRVRGPPPPPLAVHALHASHASHESADG
jgi:hypothetical protein